jgi:hypothetical protein
MMQLALQQQQMQIQQGLQQGAPERHMQVYFNPAVVLSQQDGAAVPPLAWHGCIPFFLM